MRGFSQLGTLLLVLITTGTMAQLTIPGIVQLPANDFVWNWGQRTSVDERTRPDFTINGSEERFRCTLTGAFRLGSRMTDFSNLREFEQSLNSTLYFIQDSVEVFNAYYRLNELDWGTLDCAIPNVEITEEATQKRIDRALDRAQRDRERRRSREEQSED